MKMGNDKLLTSNFPVYAFWHYKSTELGYIREQFESAQSSFMDFPMAYNDFPLFITIFQDYIIFIFPCFVEKNN